MHNAEESAQDQRRSTASILHLVFKNTAVLAAVFCAHTRLPQCVKSTFRHGVWLKSLQDNQKRFSHTDMGQARSKDVIRWEEVKEARQELARAPWTKGKGQSNASSQPRRMRRGSYPS